MSEFLTPHAVAKLATFLLYQNSVFPPLAQSRVLEGSFLGLRDGVKVGDSVKVRIRKPVVPVRWSGEGDAPGAATLNETSVDVPVLGILYDSVLLTNRELTLEISEFGTQVLAPLMAGMVEEFGRWGLEMFDQIPFHVGTAGSPPADPEQIEALHTALTLNKCPLSRSDLNTFSGSDNELFAYGGRVFLISPTTKRKIWGTIPEFRQADKRGDGGAALRSAEIGMVNNFYFAQDPMIQMHQPGTFAAGAPLVAGPVPAGATSMAIDGGVGGETLKEGDLFTITGVPGWQGVVVKNDVKDPAAADVKTYTAVGGVINNLAFYPEAPAGGFPDNAAVNLVPAHKKDAAFLPGAIVYGAFPGEPPTEGDPLSGHFFDSQAGLGFQVNYYRVPGGKRRVELMTYVYGRATQPELAVISLG